MTELSIINEAGELRAVKDLRLGEYFKRKPGAAKVYVRGAYARDSKRYSGQDWDDMNREIWLKGDTLVFVGFTF